MRFLLDTHTLAWAVGNPARLSKRARAVLQDRGNELFVSAASIWEMSIKCKAGRWPEVMAFMDERLYYGFLERLGAVELAIDGRHGRVAGQFESSHRDPFDRVIAAQAFLGGRLVLSQDALLDEFPVTRIW